jgi:hypothetical protein
MAARMIAAPVKLNVRLSRTSYPSLARHPRPVIAASAIAIDPIGIVATGAVAAAAATRILAGRAARFASTVLRWFPATMAAAVMGVGNVGGTDAARNRVMAAPAVGADGTRRAAMAPGTEIAAAGCRSPARHLRIMANADRASVSTAAAIRGAVIPIADTLSAASVMAARPTWPRPRNTIAVGANANMAARAATDMAIRAVAIQGGMEMGIAAASIATDAVCSVSAVLAIGSRTAPTSAARRWAG